MSLLVIDSKTSEEKKGRRMDIFNGFCSRLHHPIITENNHIIASVNVVCYQDRTMRQYSGEILLIKQGFGAGHIRFSEGDKALFTEGIYDLLESADSEYANGRSEHTLVVENSSSNGNGIYRLDLTEDFT